MTSENVHNDILSRHTRHQSVMPVPTFPVMPGTDRASLFLQRLGRVGAGGAECLPEDGGEGDRER